MTEFIRIKDTLIAYKDIQTQYTNTNIPVVFLHDSLGCISVWKDFPDAVAEKAGCRCIVYDRQGYGLSDPFSGENRDQGYLEEQSDFLIAFLDALKIDTCLLFGHSDGGSIALIAAGRFPERIAGIITEGAHVFVEEVTLQGIREALLSYTNTDLKTRLEKHHGNKVEALFYAWAHTWLTPEFRSWNIEHFLTSIACPVLVIQGENDEYGSNLQVEAIIKQVKGPAQKLMIPSTGHSPHREAREETLNAALTFISKTASGGFQC